MDPLGEAHEPPAQKSPEHNRAPHAGCATIIKLNSAASLFVEFRGTFWNKEKCNVNPIGKHLLICTKEMCLLMYRRA
jgi:hypothetical protein